MAKTGIGVLASGRGTNFESLVRAVGRERIDGEVRVLLANVAGAGAIDRAESLGIPAVVVKNRDFKTRAAFEQAMVAELTRHGVELVCLAGFMRILSCTFVDRFCNRVMNIHPSLLPAFAGLLGIHVHEAVIAAGVKVTGCTVHFVTNDLDAGPIIVQRAIPVLEADDAESLAERVLVEEHQAYPDAVRLFCEHRLKVEGRRVRIAD